MIEVEVQIREDIKTLDPVKVVERVCIANNLTCALKGTLAGYPGCTHWHFKKGKQAGTLEITWWETEHRLWFKVAGNRTSKWIEEELPILKEQIEESLSRR